MVIVMARLIDANELKKRILEERDAIPLKLPSAIYELGVPRTNHYGNAIRGGIRKTLRCMEQCKTVDAVPVVRCKECSKRYNPNECQMCILVYGEQHDFTSENGYCDRGERRTDE